VLKFGGGGGGGGGGFTGPGALFPEPPEQAFKETTTIATNKNLTNKDSFINYLPHNPTLDFCALVEAASSLECHSGFNLSCFGAWSGIFVDTSIAVLRVAERICARLRDAALKK
jgi:hypothetical protein